MEEFLLKLNASDPNDFAAVAAGLEKLRYRQYHREPLSKPLGDGLFELRHAGKLNTRVLWFFGRAAGSSLFTASGTKPWPIPIPDLTTARARMHDWEERYE